MKKKRVYGIMKRSTENEFKMWFSNLFKFKDLSDFSGNLYNFVFLFIYLFIFQIGILGMGKVAGFFQLYVMALSIIGLGYIITIVVRINIELIGCKD